MFHGSPPVRITPAVSSGGLGTGLGPPRATVLPLSACQGRAADAACSSALLDAHDTRSAVPDLDERPDAGLRGDSAYHARRSALRPISRATSSGDIDRSVGKPIALDERGTDSDVAESWQCAVM